MKRETAHIEMVLQHIVQSEQLRDSPKSDGLPQSETKEDGSLLAQPNVGTAPDILFPCNWISFSPGKFLSWAGIDPTNSL